jgi:excisionase family DNA binding protein
MANESERWSSVSEISEHIGVSRDTIRTWIKQGVIPHSQIGRLYKFKLSEVDAWMKSGKGKK